MSLADLLEGAASALPGDADSIRPANGDPYQLFSLLDAAGRSRVLAWLLANEPEGGLELALAWLDVEGGAEVVTAVDEDALPKAGRKALRKAVHRLRSRGVALPERDKSERVVARLPDIADDFEEAFASALDPRGSRLVYLVASIPGGGARLFEVLLDERRGIVDFQVYSAGRSRIRRFLKEAVSRTRFPAVPVSPESLRALVARVAARHPADRALPPSFAEWRSKVAVPGATPGDAVVEALPLAAGEAGDAALALAAELVKKGSVGPWGPSPSALSQLVGDRVEELAAGEAGSEDWGDLAERVFGADPPGLQAGRFRESAYVLWKLEREDDARACLAAADAFESRALADNPAARAMAEVLLSPALEATRARAAAAPADAERENEE